MGEQPPLDLGPQIDAEHHAARTAAHSALEHARRAGELLAEAKQQLPHGQWLPWLREHTSVNERTASGYMRIHREWPRLAGEANRHAIADLTITGANRLLHERRCAEQRERVTAARTRMVQPWKAALHVDDGRPVRVLRHRTNHTHWVVEIGPNEAGRQLRARVDAARQTEPWVSRLADADELDADAKYFRKHADALEQQARAARHQIDRDLRAALEAEHGPAHASTVGLDYEVTDAALQAELCTLPGERVASLLLDSVDGEGVKHCGNSICGDIRLMSLDATQITPHGDGWTRTGNECGYAADGVQDPA
jgi:hypothetical protein